MAQITIYKIDGQPRTPFKQAKDLNIQAVFGSENNADLSLESVTFSNNNSYLDRDYLYTKWLANPLEGIGVSIAVGDNINGTPYSFNFDFFTDWRDLVLNADNELNVSLRNSGSIRTLEDRAASITFALLELDNFLLNADYSNIPYIVENRKTLLEQIQILVQTWNVLKMIFDEIHKIINIASDLTTLGAAQATINLALTIANLIAIVSRLVQLMKDVQEAFFPPILYHRGVKPKTFIEKGVQYLGYDSVEWGTGLDKISKFYWCPSKNDEIGIPANVGGGSGKLKPNDYGYNLQEALNYFTEFWNWRIAVINNVVHLRPKDDPFWVQLASAQAPNVLVEDSVIYSNGTKRPNYNEFYSNTILQYTTDDSDLHTLRDLADENDPLSANNIISGVLVTANTTIDQKKVLNGQGKLMTIPHALCVRKDVIDELLDLFINAGALTGSIKDLIKAEFDQVASTIGQAFPQLEKFITTVGGRSGAMVVENHFFSTPKAVFLEDVDTGDGIVPRIPVNYNNQISAWALMEYHKYDSFVPGIRNANDPNDTNAKFIYEGVELHMNVKKFTDLINNPYFSTSGGKIGKYTSVDWNVYNDRATVTYWIYEPWMQNVTETTI